MGHKRYNQGVFRFKHGRAGKTFGCQVKSGITEKAFIALRAGRQRALDDEKQKTRIT